MYGQIHWQYKGNLYQAFCESRRVVQIVYYPLHFSVRNIRGTAGLQINILIACV